MSAILILVFVWFTLPILANVLTSITVPLALRISNEVEGFWDTVAEWGSPPAEAVNLQDALDEIDERCAKSVNLAWGKHTLGKLPGSNYSSNWNEVQELPILDEVQSYEEWHENTLGDGKPILAEDEVRTLRKEHQTNPEAWEGVALPEDGEDMP